MIQRQTARKCNIKHIIKGDFVKATDIDPGFVKTSLGDISRANIIAAVVGRVSNTEIMLDDGTGMVMFRMFNEGMLPSGISVGDAVLVIGRPREFNNEIYIAGEVISKISHDWLPVRRKEIGIMQENALCDASGPAAENKKSEETGGISDYGLLIKSIRELDTGNGALMEDVMAKAGIPDAEEKLTRLIEAGEVFEFKPGIIKLLF